MNFTDARHTARMSCKEIAAYLELSLATVKRYEQTGKAPKPVIECLKMIGGQLPEFKTKNSFQGWSFGNGYLYSPAGERFTSGDVLARIYDQQLIRSQRLEIEAMKKQVIKAKPNNVIPFPKRRPIQRELA